MYYLVYTNIVFCSLLGTATTLSFTSLLEQVIVVLYQFSVQNIVILTLISVLFCYVFFNFYNARRVYLKKILRQKQFIRAERQRISAEIHDEIGSGLTALKLYTELAVRRNPDVEEISKIDLMIGEVSSKIGEIVWSTDSTGDYLDNLIYFMSDKIKMLFIHSKIDFKCELPQHIPSRIVDGHTRRECYLLVKEIAHNALKHSEAKEVSLTIAIHIDELLIAVKDNGKGFDLNQTGYSGMGMKNIKSRTERLNGNIIVENYKGTQVYLRVPLGKEADI